MSLFGAAPSTPAAGGSLFGAATPGAGGATPFGAPPAVTPGLFGAAPATGGGLFGAATPAAPATGGLFGAAPAPAAGGGLFGAAPAPAPAGGLFGAATPAPATGGGLFGAAPTPGAPTPGGGLFGSMTTPAANPGGGLFGGGGGLFGAAPAAAPALGGGLLGAPAPQQPPVQPAPSMQNGMGDGEIFEQWQKQMVKAWDDKDYKLCSFKYIMFNDLSQAGTDGLMQPPAPDALQRARAESLASADTGLWERADAQNPNPHRFVPVQITGFSALHERRAQQLQAVRDVTATLREAEAKLRTLEDERRAAIELRLRHYSERQQILSHRVLRLSAAIERQHLLRCHSGVEPPLGASESQWISRLLELSREIDRPDAGLMRLHDVATRLARDSGADGPTGGMGGMGGGGGSGGLPSAHQLHLQNLEEWLVRQQEAVKRLIEVSQQDLRDAQIAIAEANGVRPEHVAWGA